MQFESAVLHIFNRLENELPEQYAYHSLDHSRDVFAVTEDLCEQENVLDSDRMLVLTAAAYHDAGFLIQAEDHERYSCQITQEILPDFGYSPTDISVICEIILATKIPQTPKNHLGEILADADLDYLGRDDFFSIGNRLYHEMISLGTLASWEEWQYLQIGFLEKHHYFTATSIRRREQKKSEHLEEVKLKLQQK